MNNILKKLSEMEHILTIDVHAHLGKGLPDSPLNATIENVIKVMDENQIDKAIPSPIPGYEIPEGINSTRAINNYIAKSVKEYPERFPCGFGTVELRHGEKVLEEVDRVLNVLKLKGLSWHHMYHGIPINYPLMFPVLEKLAKKRAIAFIHTAPEDLEAPVRLEILAESFPEVTFINAHPAISSAQLLASTRATKRLDNIFLDTCLVHHNARYLEWLIREAGADRVMFGSDLGYYDASIDLIMLIAAKISDEEREMILWKNAAKVFNLKLV